ncbi:MAG: FKBP-type peptidyl-prolyl cis-trans isomerase [Candidatus Kariarchaeaceae archaeon]|jgi:FKBP-type peptidyl-prolyl cis-trans isomerase 2
MIKPGSMITIDYTAKISDENGATIFDTTIEDIAREEAIYKTEKHYEPMLVVIGKGWIPLGLEKALQKSSVGELFDVSVPCEEAYGPKDPSKIKLVARREFQKLNINPSIGDRITVGNSTGTVLSVSSGRVRMDYNHVLAGKNIDYNVKVHEIVEGDANRINALIKRRLPGANLKGMEINIDDSLIKVKMPETARFFEYVQFAKAEVANDVKEIVPGYSGIEFIEYFDM